MERFNNSVHCDHPDYIYPVAQSTAFFCAPPGTYQKIHCFILLSWTLDIIPSLVISIAVLC